MIASGEQVGGGDLSLDGISRFLTTPKVGPEAADSVVLTTEELRKADDLIRLSGPSGVSVDCLFHGTEYRVSCFSAGANYCFTFTDVQSGQRFDWNYNLGTESFQDSRKKACPEPETGDFMRSFLNGYTLLNETN